MQKNLCNGQHLDSKTIQEFLKLWVAVSDLDTCNVCTSELC